MTPNSDTQAIDAEVMAHAKALWESLSTPGDDNIQTFDIEDDIVLIARAIQAAKEQQNEWRTIESAPKDGGNYEIGQEILIWEPDRQQHSIGYWRKHSHSWGNRNSAFVNPSHWMPLPSPPKGES